MMTKLILCVVGILAAAGCFYVAYELIKSSLSTKTYKMR